MTAGSTSASQADERGPVSGAGFETTANLLGNGIVVLQNHPEQLELLRAEPDRWPVAVDEILRYDSPVQVTARVATCDLSVEGRHSWHRRDDPARWGQSRSDRFLCRSASIRRDPDERTRSSSFGNGIHTCLGANLARMEGTIALQGLYERFSEIKLDVTPVRRPSVNMHGWSALPAALIA